MKLTALALALAMPATLASPAARAESPAERDARMQWWREARFGMFVHWGLYSGLAGTWQGNKVGDRGGMEWIQNHVGADTYTYAAEAVPKFRPKPGFAAEWARTAKLAGCRYVVVTTKHHEGFALHDSKVTDFDAADITGRDLVREIVDALRAEGLRVGFYHSVIDWHHPQYDFTRAKGLPYPKNGARLATAPRDHAKYLAFLHTQAHELANNYGPVDVFWWDYSKPDAEGPFWRADELVALVRKANPAVLVNNRLYRIPHIEQDDSVDRLLGFDPRHGDFTTPEQTVPSRGVPGVDWEQCMTMNTSWGFSEHDHAWKGAEQLVRTLVDIASKGGNFLLNVGPTADGSVPPESAERMAAIGRWLATNGEAVYATTASPFASLPFDGRCTAKGNTLYLHLFARPETGTITLPTKAATATLLAGNQPLATRRDGDALVITLPATLPDPAATVIRLD